MSWKKRKKTKTDRRLIKSKPTEIDGVKMKSRLEGSMFTLLKNSGLDFTYEGETFVIVVDSFFSNSSFERQKNGKGDFIDRGNKKVASIKYTPDFVIDEGEVKYVIETKGLRTSDFNIRYKLFKKYISRNDLDYKLYLPCNLKECQKVMDLILTDIQSSQNESK